MNNNGWKPVKWHCVNCGTIITGYKDSNSLIKAECGICKTVMVSKAMGRRHDRIDVYAPQGQERMYVY